MDDNLVIVLAAVLSSLIIIVSAVTKRSKSVHLSKAKRVEQSGPRPSFRTEVSAISQVATRETRYPESIFKTEKGKYKLLQLVGEGEHAEVWKALNESGIVVAIKFYKNDGKGDKSFVTEIGKLAQLVERLEDNPYVSNYVVRILDYGVSPTPYVVMDYYSENLRSLIRKGVSNVELIKIMARIARALAYASSVGVYHGDLKPENILIRKDDSKYHPVIADWGGGFTPCYAAPEIYERSGKSPTEKSDVWSFGAILYEVLTRRRLFKDLSEYEEQILREIKVEIPHNPKLEELVNKCLRRDPHDRPSFKNIYEELYDYIRTELKTSISHGMRDLKTTLELLESHIALRDSSSVKRELRNLESHRWEPGVRILIRSIRIIRELENKTATPGKVASYFNNTLSLVGENIKLKEMLEKETCLKNYPLLIERYGALMIENLRRDLIECVYRIMEVVEDYLYMTSNLTIGQRPGLERERRTKD